MPRAMRHINFVLLGTILLSGLLVGLSASGAQRASDDGIKAASQAFYAALSGTDVAAMKKAWAHTDYVVYVGPRSTAIARGWTAVEKAWDQSFANDESRRITLSEAARHTNGTLVGGRNRDRHDQTQTRVPTGTRCLYYQHLREAAGAVAHGFPPRAAQAAPSRGRA